jgi:hypothetical protein
MRIAGVVAARNRLPVGRRMDDKLFATLIGAAATLLSALIAAAVNVRTKRKFDRDLAILNKELAINQAQLKAVLDKEKSLFDARLEYEYDAKKRLYLECEPLLFQASNAVVDAKERVIGLAANAGRGHLKPGASSWLKDGYYLRSTLFRIFQPLVFFKIITGKMSQVDFSLDSSVGRRIAVLQTLHTLLSSGFEMANASHSPRPYDPYAHVSQAQRDKHPEKYVYQSLVMGTIDEAIDHMLAEQTCISWYQFNRKFENQDSDTQAFDVLRAWLSNFHPQALPVLWRVLVGYAACCEFYLSSEKLDVDDLKNLFTKKFAMHFDWRDDDQRAKITDDEVLTDVFAVREVVVDVYEKNLRRYRLAGSAR